MINLGFLNDNPVFKWVMISLVVGVFLISVVLGFGCLFSMPTLGSGLCFTPGILLGGLTG